MSANEYSQHVLEAFNRAKKRNFASQRPSTPFKELWPLYLTEPTVPGQIIYGDYQDITALRVMGADLGYPAQYPADVPQFAINAHHRSFVDGLNLLFPSDSVTAYMKEQLALPAFHDLAPGYPYEEIFELPRFARVEGKPVSAGATGFRASQEYDMLPAHFLTAPIDDPTRVRRDRKILTESEVHFAYDYSRQHPELWVGFLLWQNIMHNYANQMDGLLILPPHDF